jgi:hypothetical protein
MSIASEREGVLTAPAPDVTKEDFLRLLVGGPDGLNAIVMADFVGPNEIVHSIDWMPRLNMENYGNDVRDDLGRIISVEDFGVRRPTDALPFNTTFDTPPDSQERRDYLEHVESMMEVYERSSRPYRWIGYQMLEHFDRLHPAGAKRAILLGRPALLGMIRVTVPKNTRLEQDPHIDVLPPEHGEQLGDDATMFSMNVYYRTPDDNGGDLLTYPNGLDKPPVRVKPKPGMGVMLRTSDRHAVTAYLRGNRLSAQLFGAASKDLSVPAVAWN